MVNRIKQLREETHMTQVRLSIELEVSQETVSAYESGKHYPSVATLIKLSEIFNTSCDYILGLSDKRNLYAYPVPNLKEQLLFSKWGKLSNYQKDLLLAYADGLIAMSGMDHHE